jgi:hypothetical protein
MMLSGAVRMSPTGHEANSIHVPAMSASGGKAEMLQTGLIRRDWHLASVFKYRLFDRYRGKSGRAADAPESTSLTLSGHRA